MITERRVVTVLALATIVLVGFLLYSGGEESAPLNQASTRADTTTAPATASPMATPTPAPTTATELAVAPVGVGRCPKGARVKGATTERGDQISHRPGSVDYAGTRAEECFASSEDAEAAGYSPSDSQ